MADQEVLTKLTREQAFCEVFQVDARDQNELEERAGRTCQTLIRIGFPTALGTGLYIFFGLNMSQWFQGVELSLREGHLELPFEAELFQKWPTEHKPPGPRQKHRLNVRPPVACDRAVFARRH